MIDFAAQLVFQIMHDCACRRNGGRHLLAAKSVERLNLEMLAQCEDCLFQQKRIAVVFQRVIEFADL